MGPSPRVLTQTDIVRYFLSNIDIHPQISAALNHTVASTKHGTNLISVLENSPVLHALEKLKTVSSVAVVNDAGNIVLN
jgi:CBS domain-containing protein